MLLILYTLNVILLIQIQHKLTVYRLYKLYIKVYGDAIN